MQDNKKIMKKNPDKTGFFFALCDKIAIKSSDTGGSKMRICGFNKTTLLDYPGKVASTIFLGGCNFRCPFCQNSVLVLEPGQQPDYSQEEILAFLKKRKGILDGVCVSGGEPTLAEELEEFLYKIKELGYEIKLDTNGSRPETVKKLAEEGLIDKVAMDIKACPDNYSVLTGISHPDMDKIRETVDLLIHGELNLDYEFRTTVVRELHTRKDFEEIAEWLKGAKEYYLQAYKDSEGVLKPGFTSYTLEELKDFQQILQRTISFVGIRGID